MSKAARTGLLPAASIRRKSRELLLRGRGGRARRPGADTGPELLAEEYLTASVIGLERSVELIEGDERVAELVVADPELRDSWRSPGARTRYRRRACRRRSRRRPSWRRSAERAVPVPARAVSISRASRSWPVCDSTIPSSMWAMPLLGSSATACRAASSADDPVPADEELEIALGILDLGRDRCRTAVRVPGHR